MFILKTSMYKVLMKVLKVVLHLIPVSMPLLFSGQGAHLQLARLVRQMGCKSALLVTDKGLTQLGLYKALMTELEGVGIKVTVFDDITPDPTKEQINHGAQVVKQAQCDTVIGFGGGSSMDAAKLISILPVVDKPLEKLVGVLKVKKRGLPLYLIPTTAGTGSEVSVGAVVTDTQSGQKMPVADPVLLPIAAALDPDLMVGLPPSVTAATGFDALTHAVEAFISTNATKETDRYAKTATQLIWQNLPLCMENPKDIAAREAMAMASSYAALAFSKAGLGYTHGIAHQLGALYHVPHGEANALVLPHVLQFSYPKVVKRLAELGRLVGLADGSNEVVAQAFVKAVFEMQKEVGLPSTLAALKKEDYEEISRNAFKEAHGLYAVPRYMTKQQCFSVLDSISAN